MRFTSASAFLNRIVLRTESESKATSSLSAMFSSKASGKWECPTCMCSNDATMMKCPACETMQPKAKPIAEPEVNSLVDIL